MTRYSKLALAAALAATMGATAAVGTASAEDYGRPAVEHSTGPDQYGYDNPYFWQHRREHRDERRFEFVRHHRMWEFFRHMHDYRY